ncbi:MAG TPA: helix-turn-helix transcriptional regulator [Syntrophales bacterium]|nr:helix-turn-helix transcriptional regulator [Syntrophales bacterium]
MHRPVEPKQGKSGRFPDRGELPVPTNPVIMATLRAIYAGGSRPHWQSNSFGRPFYRHEARDGRISLFFESPPDFKSLFHPYYISTPRMDFVYTGKLRQIVSRLSVETADVFLILMSRIACLSHPLTGIARIGLEEIAKLRGVNLRHGSSRSLFEDFRQEVLRLADMRLSMSWKDYRGGGTISLGRERPDRLLDILDMEYEKDGRTWTAFRFRCGQALSHFLDPEGLRWIGYYSRSLLGLNPYTDAFTKKLGTYWIMLGIIAGKKGQQPAATPRTILDFCGEAIHWHAPGRTVDAFIRAHERLAEIGVLDTSPVLEPPDRGRGYFRQWLGQPLTVKLSDHLWRIREAPRKRLSAKRQRKQESVSLAPSTVRDLQANPALIRQLRADRLLRQEELAGSLGVTRQTLSGYERGLRPLPEDKAIVLLDIWQRGSRQ